jgi:hypothetical protein
VKAAVAAAISSHSSATPFDGSAFALVYLFAALTPQHRKLGWRFISIEVFQAF